ncbi:MAG: hypothetical protein CVU55_13045 [Deltaproteobacteria bacterium HGW-Deltaproteobacteria-13]|nr:MAG: hypothetical protein CVU55_13045 [Deltaproteobacteria bacterium HGW-Deltaproteobacteria-13]
MVLNIFSSWKLQDTLYNAISEGRFRHAGKNLRQGKVPFIMRVLWGCTPGFIFVEKTGKPGESGALQLNLHTRHVE